MKIIDLHQDIILSYEQQPRDFIIGGKSNSPVYDAGSYEAYRQNNIHIVFGAIRPYTLEGDILDIENRSITYSSQKLLQYINAYKTLAPEAPIITEKEHIQASGLHLVLHVEGFDLGTLDDLEEIAALGVKSLGFSWNYDNHWCGCAHTESHHGLTELGRQGIQLLEEKKILVDTAHMSHEAMMETISIATRPLINSHSNAYAIYTHPRNVKDERLLLLAKNGGVLGVNIYQEFLSNHETSLESFFRHIDHLRNIIGDDHIALGTDFHGIPTAKTIGSINHISEIPTLYEQFHGRYGEACTQKFFYNNALRVIESCL